MKPVDKLLSGKRSLKTSVKYMICACIPLEWLFFMLNVTVLRIKNTSE